METINKVLLVSGTHGNELSGIYLNKLIKERLYPAERTSFSTHTIIANPQAMAHNQRFIESDLNREFSAESLDQEATTVEQKRAKQLAKEHSNTKNQLIIDLHNTTSNMGATLILLSEHPFYQRMGAYVKQRMPQANILFESRKPWSAQPYLCSMGEYGVMIEVGAQAHGSLKFDVLELMKNMLTAVLDYLEQHNLNQNRQFESYDAYFYTEEVQLPLDSDGLRLATVHPTICGKDFEAVSCGEPLLATFFGYDIHWEKEHDIFPHFINESAYGTDNIAMALAEKKRVKMV